MDRRMTRIYAHLAVTAVISLCLSSASAQTVKTDPDAPDFYKGKNINIYIGVAIGGAYDLEARLIGRHISSFIPGRPTIVPQNMIGAGGITMANYLQNLAAKDGTAVGMVPNTLVSLQAVKAQGVRFDAAQFGWVGALSQSVETIVAWHTTGVSSIEDLRNREFISGATSKGALVYTLPAVLNEFLGTKLKIVTGYQGINQVNLALERREVDVVAGSWTGWKLTKSNWLNDKTIRILVQTEPKSAELPDVPSIQELATSDDDRQIITLLLSGSVIGRPLAVAPGTASSRIQTLRQAFTAMVPDKSFRADAQIGQIELAPISGEFIERVVSDVLKTPPHLAERARNIIE